MLTSLRAIAARLEASCSSVMEEGNEYPEGQAASGGDDGSTVVVVSVGCTPEKEEKEGESQGDWDGKGADGGGFSGVRKGKGKARGSSSMSSLSSQVSRVSGVGSSSGAVVPVSSSLLGKGCDWKETVMDNAKGSTAAAADTLGSSAGVSGIVRVSPKLCSDAASRRRRENVRRALAELTQALASVALARNTERGEISSTQDAARVVSVRGGGGGQGITTFEAEESGVLRALLRALFSGRHRGGLEEHYCQNGGGGGSGGSSADQRNVGADERNTSGCYKKGETPAATVRTELMVQSEQAAGSTRVVVASGTEESEGTQVEGVEQARPANAGQSDPKARKSNTESISHVPFASEIHAAAEATNSCATSSGSSSSNEKQVSRGGDDAMDVVTYGTATPMTTASATTKITSTMSSGPQAVPMAENPGGAGQRAKEPQREKRTGSGVLPDGTFFVEMGKAFFTPREKDGRLPMEDLIAATQACLQVMITVIHNGILMVGI